MDLISGCLLSYAKLPINYEYNAAFVLEEGRPCHDNIYSNPGYLFDPYTMNNIGMICVLSMKDNKCDTNNPNKNKVKLKLNTKKEDAHLNFENCLTIVSGIYDTLLRTHQMNEHTSGRPHTIWVFNEEIHKRLSRDQNKLLNYYKVLNQPFIPTDVVLADTTTLLDRIPLIERCKKLVPESSGHKNISEMVKLNARNLSKMIRQKKSKGADAGKRKDRYLDDELYKSLKNHEIINFIKNAHLEELLNRNYFKSPMDLQAYKQALDSMGRRDLLDTAQKLNSILHGMGECATRTSQLRRWDDDEESKEPIRVLPGDHSHNSKFTHCLPPYGLEQLELELLAMDEFIRIRRRVFIMDPVGITVGNSYQSYVEVLHDRYPETLILIAYNHLFDDQENVRGVTIGGMYSRTSEFELLEECSRSQPRHEPLLLPEILSTVKKLFEPSPLPDEGLTKSPTLSVPDRVRVCIGCHNACPRSEFSKTQWQHKKNKCIKCTVKETLKANNSPTIVHQCPICLNEDEDNDDIFISYPCHTTHVIHKTCQEAWKITQTNYGQLHTCPYCRAPCKN